jgi:small subunit ribosomal protein S6
MVILDPELEERTVAPSLETYLKIIKESGGKVDKLDIWGKRRMTFEMKKKSEGTVKLPQSKSWIVNLI